MTSGLLWFVIICLFGILSDNLHLSYMIIVSPKMTDPILNEWKPFILDFKNISKYIKTSRVCHCKWTDPALWHWHINDTTHVCRCVWCDLLPVTYSWVTDWTKQTKASYFKWFIDWYWLFKWRAFYSHTFSFRCCHMYLSLWYISCTFGK